MKRIISLFLAIGIMITTEYTGSYIVYANSNAAPVITMEISDYNSENDITGRTGRGKTSATAGDRIVLTFVLSGISAIECYQISGIYNTDALRAGRYSADRWINGTDEQDYSTIITHSEDTFDESFSYTRTDEEPFICLVGFSLDGTVSINSSGTTLISVGFEVLCDIDNIYDEFSFDDNTMVGVTLNDEEYFIDNGLTIGCIHQYVMTVVPADCENEGYSLYSCINCNDEYKNNYIEAYGHNYSFSGKVNNNDFCYTCSSCDNSIVKTAQELNALWDIIYINKPVHPSSSDNSIYLDVCKDNIINAKDFSMINKAL